MGIRDLWLREIMNSLRSAKGSVAEESEEDDARKYDADDDEDDDDDDDADEGGVGAATGVTGADCAHEVLSAACAPTRSNFFGFDARLSDVRDTVEPVFLLGVSHNDDAHVFGDKIGGFDGDRFTGAVDVALGNKE